MIIDDELIKYGLDEEIIRHFFSKTKKRNKEIESTKFIRCENGDITFHLYLVNSYNQLHYDSMTLTISLNKIRNYKINKILD
jgi:hypothetical protein